MHDAALVRVLECFSHVTQNAHDLVERHRPAAAGRLALQANAEGLTRHEGHREIRKPIRRHTRREHRHDVGLLKRGGEANLALEALRA